jgi:hypothetical protein
MSSPAEVTLLLRAWRAGDAEADEPLIEVLYRELSDMRTADSSASAPSPSVLR